MNLFDVLFAKKLSGGGPPFPPVIKRVTGNPIEFTNGADAPLVKCVTQITGSQDLHGQDKPWVGGAGRNKMPASLAGSTSKNGITIISDGNGTYTINGTATAQTTIEFDLITSYEIPIAVSRGGNGCFNMCNSFVAQASLRLYNDSEQVDSWSLNSVNKYSSSYASMGGKTINKIFFVIANGETINGTVSPMFTEDGTSTYSAFSPYSNICPITAYTEGEIEVSDGDGNTTTHTTTYPNAIYRGSEDVVNGEVTSEMPVVSSPTWKGFLAGTYGVCNYFQLAHGATVVDPSALHNAICNMKKERVAYWGDARRVNESGMSDCFAINQAGTQVIVYDTDTSLSESDFATKYAGIQIAYPLATPTTSSVTPTNLPVKSLSGYNHIESSTGEMQVDYITDAYQNFVDTTERAIPSTRKGGVKAFDIFKTLDEPKKPEAPAEESEPEEKETEEGAKK